MRSPIESNRLPGSSSVSNWFATRFISIPNINVLVPSEPQTSWSVVTSRIHYVGNGYSVFDEIASNLKFDFFLGFWAFLSCQMFQRAWNYFQSNAIGKVQVFPPSYYETNPWVRIITRFKQLSTAAFLALFLTGPDILKTISSNVDG